MTEPQVQTEQTVSPQPMTVVTARPAAPPRSLGGALLGTLQSLAATVVIALFVITFAVQAFQIPSESMEKTLLIGDYLLVDKVLFGQSNMGGVLPYRDVRRGDVVVFRPPHHPEQHFVKRVVGLPGDRVRMLGRGVWINGTRLDEEYAAYVAGAGPRTAFPAAEAQGNVDPAWRDTMELHRRGRELEVPAGQYFVLGDNRDHSLDSRYWGFVPRENIVGRPLLIYFSMARAGGVTPASAATDATLTRLGQALTQALGNARWERTFRLVR